MAETTGRTQPIESMRQLELFSALQSSTEGIDTEFKSIPGSVEKSLRHMPFEKIMTPLLGLRR